MGSLRRGLGIGFICLWGWVGPSTSSGSEPFDPFDRLRAGRLRMWTLWPVR